MGSITTWARLEPHSRSADMEAGLEMRVHDPLWMLARQWQFGEFHGEDTGSPVWTSVSGIERPIEHYLPGPIAGHGAADVQDYSSDVPLEYLVEHDAHQARDVMAANRRLAVEAGRHFLSLFDPPLAAGDRAALLTLFGIAPLNAAERERTDPESVAFLDLVAGRALDGSLLLAAVQDRTAEDAVAALGFGRGDVARVAPAIKVWLAWCSDNVGETTASQMRRPAWNPERMEYACALAAPGRRAGEQAVLVAREYPGGHLDWYSFDVIDGARLARPPVAAARKFAAAAPPTGLSFRGLPSSRLWEFEDAQVRFGAIEAGPTDLARLLLIEFLIQYGNDFFVIPIDAVAGTLLGIDSVTITNTFGDTTAVAAVAEPEWRLFALSTGGAGASAPSLFLPPVLGAHLVGPAVEQIALTRDEGANVAWAIEHVVLSKAGAPLNRHEQYQARRQREIGVQPPPAGAMQYRLDTWESSRPDYWIPLIPERSALNESASRLVCYDAAGDVRGQLLSEKGSAAWLSLHNEEVPRGGVQVTRVPQYTRWYGGRIYTWIGREKRPGRGGASSGLRYDAVEIAPGNSPVI